MIVLACARMASKKSAHRERTYERDTTRTLEVTSLPEMEDADMLLACAMASNASVSAELRSAVFVGVVRERTPARAVADEGVAARTLK